jgi:hypothetical protein
MWGIQLAEKLSDPQQEIFSMILAKPTSLHANYLRRLKADGAAN